ncbi:hypothetical protein B0H16DRAFT_1817074 [Mycena metata]|uniref:Autophagy-related protein 4 n=1 Tax=Mycena metata TaxID=1033252 RepID=A0AAD7H3V8_9AGAR|nr:hypothetical protein B0H16DRAFT_1817074 [Mycena metata]
MHLVAKHLAQHVQESSFELFSHECLREHFVRVDCRTRFHVPQDCSLDYLFPAATLATVTALAVIRALAITLPLPTELVALVAGLLVAGVEGLSASLEKRANGLGRGTEVAGGVRKRAQVGGVVAAAADVAVEWAVVYAALAVEGGVDNDVTDEADDNRPRSPFFHDHDNGHPSAPSTPPQLRPQRFPHRRNCARNNLNLQPQRPQHATAEAAAALLWRCRRRRRPSHRSSALPLRISTPPSSASSSSHGHAADLTLARTPSRLGADGALGTRLSGWFAHLAGSTSDLSLTGMLSSSISHAASLASSTSVARKTPTSPKAGKDKAGGKPSLLDKAVRYLLDGDAAPDRNGEDIWLMGVRLPGWGREDEERVATAAAAASFSSHSSHSHSSHAHGTSKSDSGHAPSTHVNITHRTHKRCPSRDIAASPSPLSSSLSPSSLPPSSALSPSPSSSSAQPNESDEWTPPDAGPWPRAFFAAFYAHVWCTYRAGFEPIRDLPGLASLPPPLFFPNTASTSSTHASASNTSLNSSTSGGGEGMGSSNTTVVLHPHAASGMRHSLAQSYSSYSSGSARGASRASEASHASHVNTASGSSYASSSYGSASAQSGAAPPGTTWAKKKWFSLPPLSALSSTKGWTSDTDWGCMLRTGQSLLATALGRVGGASRLSHVVQLPGVPTPPAPFPPSTRGAHAAHGRLLSWFLDAPAAPFGVHRIALAGKAAGKGVGMWFGPSIIYLCIATLSHGLSLPFFIFLSLRLPTHANLFHRTLVDAFPVCGLGVAVAVDGTFYQTDVFAASHSPSRPSSSTRTPAPHTVTARHRLPTGTAMHAAPPPRRRRRGKEETKRWGDRPVLLLLGIKLGIEGVNPVYYETIKSVGIAGGRPSSSYYFVGAQGDGLFYLDPHHSRPSVPLRPFLGEPLISAHGSPSSSSTTSSRINERRSLSPEAYARGGSMSPESGYAHGGFAHGQGAGQSPMTEDELILRRDEPDAPPACQPAGGPLTPAEEAFYSAAELRTFHCERVRKMPMSGLDPSMLIGFVCQDEAEWVDLRRQVKELLRTIFAIVDEPPTWPGADDDDDMGLESISDPEEVADAGYDDGEGDGDADLSSVSHASHAVSSTSHVAASAFSHTHAHHGSNSTTHSNSTTTSTSSGVRSSEVDTEEDPVAPITPLPGSRFDLSGGPTPAAAAAATKGKGKTAGDAYAELEGDDSFIDAGGEIEIEDDWVNPVSPPVSPVSTPPVPVPAPPPLKKSASSKSKKGSKGKKAVPVPSVHYPFPVSVEDSPEARPGSGRSASPPHRERGERERERNVTVSPRASGAVTGQRMHTARVRDGGRTQSGGVRGVLTED